MTPILPTPILPQIVAKMPTQNPKNYPLFMVGFESKVGLKEKKKNEHPTLPHQSSTFILHGLIAKLFLRTTVAPLPPPLCPTSRGLSSSSASAAAQVLRLCCHTAVDWCFLLLLSASLLPLHQDYNCLSFAPSYAKNLHYNIMTSQ